MIDWNKTLFRCHRSGDIMTEPRSKSESLSATCKTYLRQLYREKKYHRYKSIVSKYIDKGLAVEEDSLTLYSRVKGRMFKKNEERILDEFIIGEPDTYEGKSIKEADVIIDTKSCWDLFTMPFPDDSIDKGYYWQLQGYMSLTGASSAALAYCLVDTPDHLIQKEIDSIRWRTGLEATPEQRERIIKEMKFDDIPMNERVVEFIINRDDKAIEAVHNRVLECREYLKFLDERKIVSV